MMTTNSLGDSVRPATVTLMITPHGTAQAPSPSKAAELREASSRQATGQEDRTSRTRPTNY